MEPRKHILIVDDDAELASLLAQAISDVPEGYEVRTAKDVDGAMVQVHRAQTAQQPYDLVITDIKMLGLSGLELLEALRAIAPETKTITMTAYNSPDLAERAQELGVYAYLTKPFVLSEFRQIVHSALYPDHAQAVEPIREAARQLPPSQEKAIGRHLAALRTMSGADTVALLHLNGMVLAAETSHNQVHLDDILMALVNAQQCISEQLVATFDNSAPIRQSYFGTETHNICTYRLDQEHIVAVFFGPTVKEGQVWYYLRDAVDRIQAALSQEATTPPKSSSERANDLMDMIDQYFPPRKQPWSRSRQPRREEKALDRQETPVMAEPPALPQPSPPPADLPSIDEMNWDIVPDTSWDDIAAVTDQGFVGLSYQEAQSQGLLPEQPAPETIPTIASAPVLPPNAPPIDEIDWNMATDVDWDDLVAQTDQGFTGMTLDEAQEQGLIDDLAQE